VSACAVARPQLLRVCTVPRRSHPRTVRHALARRDR